MHLFYFSYSKEPLFVVKPRSSEAFEGDTVIIFCEVVGDPKPEVVWLRDFLNVSISLFFLFYNLRRRGTATKSQNTSERMTIT